MAEESITIETEEQSTLFDDLGQWAAANGSEDDSYLQLVAQVLLGTEPSSRLVGLDPDKWFPQSQVLIANRVAWAVRVLSILRNVLIFSPVAITWFAISKATEAFNLYVSQNNDVPVNFLQFWQDGYGILSKEWTIANVALVDFSIITVIALLSLAIGGGQTFGSRAVSRISRLQEANRKRIIIRLINEFPEIVVPNSTANSSPSKDSEAAISRIERALQKLEPLLTSFNTSLQKSKASIDEVENISKIAQEKIATQLIPIQSSLGEFGAQVDLLTSASNAALENLKSTDASVSNSASRVESTAEELVVISNEARDALLRLKKSLSKITSNIE